MAHEPFSVAMCVYGGDDPTFFRTAVESVLHQTAVPDEMILVVDGPVPEQLEQVISDYEKRAEFHTIRLPENQGHGNARRTGLDACSHELVALMDADDISLPDRFEKELSCFSEFPEVSVVGGQISEFVGDPANTVGKRIVPCTDEELKRFMKKRCPFNQITVMLRKSEVSSAGGYMDWYCDEDYYLWLRMALNGAKFACVPDILVNVRVGEQMYQRRGGWKYFCSERKLQRFMLRKKIIGMPQYLVNVTKRLIVQVLLPNRLRGWVFQHFARE